MILDFGFKHLKDFPTEVFRYKDILEVLLLGNNEIETIPVEIRELKNLKVLDLSNNSIKRIPKELGELSSIRKLYIDNNVIEDVPPEVGNLSTMEELFLNNNLLTSIPPELGNLTNLLILYLYKNNITSIPRELGKLSNIKELSLNDNLLTSIPPELGNLSNIEILFLHSNRITSIPPELGNLPAIKILQLNRNLLHAVPKELGNLRTIKILNLSINQITSIPPELGDIQDMDVLSLHRNNLSTLPSEIGNFRNIQVLTFGDNPLEYIPPQVQRLVDRQQIIEGVYTDKQSIHNSGIQRSFRKSVTRLTNREPVLDLERTLQELVESSLPEKTKETIVEYSTDNNIHGELNITFGELLVVVWDRIRVHPRKDELLKRVHEEMTDALCMCFTGRITRLVNVLSGYDSDVEISISDNEQLSQLILITKERIVPYDTQVHRASFKKEALERGYSLDTIQEWMQYIE